MYDRLRKQPIYRGDPPAPDLLPPAQGDAIAPQRPNSRESAQIVKKIGELRERLLRMEQHQRKGLSDPAFDREIDRARGDLKSWEKALAARAETGT